MGVVRIDIKTTNPSNGALGMSREAAGREMSLRKKQRATVALLMRQLDARAFAAGCRVTVVRIAPSKGLDAHDNLRSALKHVVDGIADWLGIRDDDPRVTWSYGQRRGRPREYAVEITVEKGQKL